MLKNFKQRKPIGRGLGTWQNEGNLPYPKQWVDNCLFMSLTVSNKGSNAIQFSPLTPNLKPTTNKLHIISYYYSIANYVSIIWIIPHGSMNIKNIKKSLIISNFWSINFFIKKSFSNQSDIKFVQFFVKIWLILCIPIKQRLVFYVEIKFLLTSMYKSNFS